MSDRKKNFFLILLIVIDVYLLYLKFGLAIPQYTLPVETSSFFSLGDAVAALALVFAVTQLADESWALTLRIKGRLKSNAVWLLLALGLATTLISAMLPQPANTNISVYKNPLFWQIIAFLCFAASPFVLRHIGRHRRKLFRKSTAPRYYRVLLEAYSTGDDKQIKAATDIILESLDSVVEFIKPKPFKVTLRIRIHSKISKNRLGKKYVQWLNKGQAMRTAKKLEGQKKDTSPTQYAYSLFNTALTDKAVSSYIATSRIDFIWNFTQAIIRKRLDGHSLRGGFNSIVSQLFTNSNSYLYRQSEYQGTGRFAPINNLIFGSKYLAQSFEPIRAWNELGGSSADVKAEEYVQVFLRALESSIKNDAFSNSRVGESIGLAMYELVEYARRLVFSSDDALNEHHMAFWRIEQFFNRGFLELYSDAIKAGKVSDTEKSAPKGEKYRQQSLATTYAECYVDFLGELSRYQKDDMSLHQLVVLSLDELFQNVEYSNMRDRFSEYAWEAIDNSVGKGFYPAFVNVYIRIMYFKRSKEGAWIKAERAKMMKLINGDLKKKIKARAMMNNKHDYMEDFLLPREMKYDRKKASSCGLIVLAIHRNLNSQYLVIWARKKLYLY
jgi:hypothetical protein